MAKKKLYTLQCLSRMLYRCLLGPFALWYILTEMFLSALCQNPAYWWKWHTEVSSLCCAEIDRHALVSVLWSWVHHCLVYICLKLWWSLVSFNCDKVNFFKSSDYMWFEVYFVKQWKSETRLFSGPICWQNPFPSFTLKLCLSQLVTNRQTLLTDFSLTVCVFWLGNRVIIERCVLIPVTLSILCCSFS